MPGPSAAAGTARASVAVFALGDEDHVVVGVGRARGGGGRRRRAGDALDQVRIGVSAGRVGVGRARVVGAHVVGQGMAASVEDSATDRAAGSGVEGDVAVGVVLVETENREVRFVLEAGFPVVGVMGCQLGLGSICPMSGKPGETLECRGAV